MLQPYEPVMITTPSSLMSMASTLVSSQMLLIISPPLPMIFPMYLVGTVTLWIWGANSERAPAGGGLAFSISPRMCTRPLLAASSAWRSTARVMPSTLMSIWNALMPAPSPATLKSMSPRASSLPRMSVRMMASSPLDASPRIRPMAMPATFLVMGTPASCSAKHPAHTVAMELEPLLSVMVDSSRTVKGKSLALGITGISARSARLPCPISRRVTAPMRPVSPTEEGGKK
mmetsp:Transcript_23976/g.58762  ORF Transcript_23976/g.58762 Transcript_23976/m.58762 type:complete len:231 (-) Transcript_23976:1278-1970(-)